MARPEELWFGWMHGRHFRLTKDYSVIAVRWKDYVKGAIVKAVMVSRMGDVGVTLNLEALNGYDLRVAPWELDPVAPRPDNVCALCNLDLQAIDHFQCRADRKCDRCQGETGPADPVCSACLLKEWSAGRT